MNQENTPSPKEKDFPEAWKALFLGIDSTKTVEVFVKCLVRKVLEFNEDEQESFYTNYKKPEFKERVKKIFNEEKYEELDNTLASRIMKPFYARLNVRNLRSFLEKLQSLPTPPQSPESRS